MKKEETSKEGSRFNETDVYRVKRDSRMNTGIYMCKLVLKKHGSVQIEGMGQSISLVTKLAQILKKNGLATIQNINSSNVQRDNTRSINPKLSIRLVKTGEFDKLTEGIVLKQ